MLPYDLMMWIKNNLLFWTKRHKAGNTFSFYKEIKNWFHSPTNSTCRLNYIVPRGEEKQQQTFVSEMTNAPLSEDLQGNFRFGFSLVWLHFHDNGLLRINGPDIWVCMWETAVHDFEKIFIISLVSQRFVMHCGRGISGRGGGEGWVVGL